MTTVAQPIKVPIHPGYVSEENTRELCGVARLREFNVQATVGPCHVVTRKTWPYKGSAKKWPKIINDAYITSYVEFTPTCAAVHHATRGDRQLRAPAGTFFDQDELGFRVVRKSDRLDWHPDIKTIYATDFVACCRRAMAFKYKQQVAANKQARFTTKNQAECARIEKKFQRDLLNIRVTLADSRQAGNCVEGTLKFVELKFKIPRETVLAGGHLFSLPADKILASTNGQRDAAMRAVRWAWLRETTICI